MSAPLEPQDLLTPGEVARLLGINVKSVARRARAGHLRYIRTAGSDGNPGHRRFPAKQFEGKLDPSEQQHERTAVTTVRRVRALHLPFRHRDGHACRGCSKVAGRPIAHPCPTWLVLNGAEVEPEPTPVVEVEASSDPVEAAALADVAKVLGGLER